MKIFLALFCFSHLFSANCISQPYLNCNTVKMGDAYFIDCKYIITFGAEETRGILNVGESKSGTIRVYLEVFSPNGKKTATVKESVITEGNKEQFILKSSHEEFSLIEKKTNRVICLIKKIFNKEKNRCELNLWANIFMPDGFNFQCTPETTNVPELVFHNTTLSGADYGITLD